MIPILDALRCELIRILAGSKPIAINLTLAGGAVINPVAQNAYIRNCIVWQTGRNHVAGNISP